MNLANAISRQARARPHAVALMRDGGAKLRYAELDRAVRRTALVFLREGIAPGDVIGVAMRNQPLHVLVLLALARMGAISVPVAPGLPEAPRQEIARRFGVKVIVADAKAPPLKGVARLLADAAWLEPGQPAAAAPAFSAGGVWRIALSSGTTGAPKGAAHTHRSSLEQALLQRSAIEFSADARFLASMDMNITFGLNPILRHLVAGSTVVFPRGPRAEHHAEAIDRCGVTHMGTSPITLRGLVEAARGAPEPRFPGLRHLTVGGGALQPALLRAALQRLTRNLWLQYGTSEVGALTLADLPTLLLHPGTIGRTMPWVEMQVVDEAGRRLPAGKSGTLRFRGLGFAEGYYADPKASARSFRDGWFHPGDTGSVSAEGLITLEGRSDDLINLSGNKVQPETVERVLQAHPEVAEAAVFGVKGASGKTALYAAVVTRGTVSDEDLQAQCRQQLGRVHTPQGFLRLAELPRTALGKISRAELAARVALARPAR